MTDLVPQDWRDESIQESRNEANRWRRIAALVIAEYAGGRFTDMGEPMPLITVVNNVYEIPSKRVKATDAPLVKHATGSKPADHDEPIADDYPPQSHLEPTPAYQPPPMSH